MRAHVGEVRRPEPVDKDPARKLRIGDLSPDLKRHPCAYFFEPILRHHDRDSVHVTVYQCNPPGKFDKYTAMLKELADEWVEVAHLSEQKIAERVRQDQIDIAVDLAGHAVLRPANKSPCQVLAHYPAPVQVTWIGYPNTTGVDCIHYRFVDEISDPPDANQWHSEHLWRLPDCFLSFAAPQDLLDTPVQPSPCIANGYVTFGSIRFGMLISVQFSRRIAVFLATCSTICGCFDNHKVAVLHRHL